MTKPKAYVLDSWSMLAYWGDEPAGQKIADLIADAHETGTPLMMSVVNVGEVWYIVAREVSETEADNSISEIKHLGIEFVDVNWNLTQEASRFKAKHKMSYADCFAAALARENKAALVTGDPEFKQMEDRVRIYWV